MIETNKIVSRGNTLHLRHDTEAAIITICYNPKVIEGEQIIEDLKKLYLPSKTKNNMSEYIATITGRSEKPNQELKDGKGIEYQETDMNLSSFQGPAEYGRMLQIALGAVHTADHIQLTKEQVHELLTVLSEFLTYE